MVLLFGDTAEKPKVFGRSGRIAQSRPFRFIVGLNEKEFFMHADLVASMSKVLNVLVNGSCNGTAKLDEARTSLAVWADVDEGTFVRFCEFAYTSNYRAADPALPEPLSNETKDASIPSCPLDEQVFRKPLIEVPSAEIQPVETLPIQDSMTYEAREPVPVPEPEVLESDLWSLTTSKKDKKKKKKSAIGMGQVQVAEV
ncbi:hypothetical protein TruAng_011870 [Truncatella angustata]|nr:hypothetical protein TruAng_011870 [Truncatella angustata]